MSLKLRDLIKAVRACKTAAEERAAIQKECANIRTAFREDDNEYRHRNVAKLLYIHMLGYQTNWGQMECLKLIASAYYSDKRIGYLGLMVLMDETQEVLTLVTNHMKNDLNHPNQFITGLALCALANISSSGIARDLAPEVEKLLASSNSYIRKKAALSAIRILRKCPDLMENFVPKIRALLSERNHGVLLTGVTLMTELCEAEASNIEFFRRLVPTLVRILKNLVMSGYAPEYDVSGVTDPFLQVKILRLLRLLGREDAESSDAMNDILAQVATNTDHTRNVGNAILYECVSTIMSIQAEGGLRVLAINVLGRFLQNKDNNIRYVALSTLSKVVSADLEAVQRHRNTIVDCLKDPDVSIRRRALDLIYALVNETNIKILVHELLNFLQTASLEFRAELTAKLCRVTEKYAPNKRWHVDTILRIMAISGPHVPEEVAANLVSLVASTPELHSYAVQKMYLALLSDFTQKILAQVSTWSIGEFGDLLVATGTDKEITVSETHVIDLLEKVIKFPASSPVTKQYTVTALMKLTTRFSTNSSQRLKDLIALHRTHIEVEIQQRACEYTKLFNYNSIIKSLFERIPVIEEKQENFKPAEAVSSGNTGRPIIEWDVGSSEPVTERKPAPATPAAPTKNILEELFGPSLTPAPSVAPVTPTPSPLLSMESLLGAIPVTPATPLVPVTPLTPMTPIAPTPLVSTPLTSLMDPAVSPIIAPSSVLSPSIAAKPPLNGPLPTFVGFQKGGVTAYFDVIKQASAPQMTVVTASFANSNPAAITNWDCKAATPKYVKVQVFPASGDTIPPNTSGRISQQFKLLNTLHGEKPPLLRLKLDYQMNGMPVSDIADITFPEGV